MRRGKGIDGPSLLGLPLAVAVVLLAQVAEGGKRPIAVAADGRDGRVRRHGCGGPRELSARSRAADVRGRRPGVSQAFRTRGRWRPPSVNCSGGRSKRGAAASSRSSRNWTAPARVFLRNALTLAVDGTHPNIGAHILEIESYAHRVRGRAPARRAGDGGGLHAHARDPRRRARADPRNGEPSASRPSSAPASPSRFVATVYGVGMANLILLPLATRLRGLARDAALAPRVDHRKASSPLQEGLNPRLIEQKLQGFVTPARERARPVRAA